MKSLPNAAVAAIIVTLAMTGGCHGEPPPLRAASLVPAADGGADSAPVAPASPAIGGEGLLSAASRFETVGRCVADVARRLPPELTRDPASAQLALRACQTRRAIHRKSVALCGEIGEARWILRCRRLYARAHRDAASCPARSPRTAGREPLCVALASGRRGLCLAVADGAARARCQRELGGATKRWDSGFAPAFSLTLISRRRYRIGKRWQHRQQMMRRMDLEQGVVVPRPGAKPGARWLLGDLGGRVGDVTFSLDVPTPTRVPVTIPVGHRPGDAMACITIAGLPVGALGTLVLKHYRAKRGARISGEFTLQLVGHKTFIRLNGIFETYVRDVIPGAWAIGGCRYGGKVHTSPLTTGRDAAEGRPCYFVEHYGTGDRLLGFRAHVVKVGQACDRLGLRRGDVLFAINGRKVKRFKDLRPLYQRLQRRDPMTVRVLRDSKTKLLRWP